MKVLFCILFSCLCIGACKPELPDGEVLIKEIYDSRVAEYKSQRFRDCHEKAVAEAEAVVDSIVHNVLRLGLADTIAFPEKPTRPNSPDHILGTVKKFDPNEKEASDNNR